MTVPSSSSQVLGDVTALRGTSARSTASTRARWIHLRLTPWGLICQSDSHLTRMQARPAGVVWTSRIGPSLSLPGPVPWLRAPARPRER